MPLPRNHKPGSRPGTHQPDRIETYPVTEEGPLMQFLLEAMPDRKRTTVKNLLGNSQVAVNRLPVTQFNHQLMPGDIVQVNLVRPFITFRHNRLKLVYEDDDLIVIDKGYGLLSMGTDTKKDGTAYSILRDYVKWSDPRNKIFIVHRLDRDTTGLMMFAKTAEAKDALQHNWNNMVLKREYVAVVEGIIEEDSGVQRSLLGENAQHEVYSVPEGTPGAKPAVTRWRVLHRGKGRTLVAVSLDTGRKNQIRVHMKEMGHPIVGDRRYGAKVSPIHRLALHARTLDFVHPITHKNLTFSTPIPASFLSLVR